MDALQNFFFWTWKIGNSTVLGTSSSPMWHYRLGLARGWIPQGLCFISFLPGSSSICPLFCSRRLPSLCSCRGLYGAVKCGLLWWVIDPREAAGHCASVLGSSQIFDGTYPASATGGVSLYSCHNGIFMIFPISVGCGKYYSQSKNRPSVPTTDDRALIHRDTDVSFADVHTYRVNQDPACTNAHCCAFGQRRQWLG